MMGLAPQDQGYAAAHKAFNKSLSLLGCEYIDLYLIHWPGVRVSPLSTQSQLARLFHAPCSQLGTAQHRQNECQNTCRNVEVDITSVVVFVQRCAVIQCILGCWKKSWRAVGSVLLECPITLVRICFCLYLHSHIPINAHTIMHRYLNTSICLHIYVPFTISWSVITHSCSASLGGDGIVREDSSFC
jgi:hypothetical protein